ncbi:hypothetical protein CEXT_123431 [Caerostris extrusa]|uniref:Uncharacterized protein n=1 Tax=Caerostris extrusa TaxID=172846 RepID=A0AAV4MPY2_CAEEX|nr:hypothetical protein CEXT_123431 [Caerostris extrusa]
MDPHSPSRKRAPLNWKMSKIGDSNDFVVDSPSENFALQKWSNYEKCRTAKKTCRLLCSRSISSIRMTKSLMRKGILIFKTHKFSLELKHTYSFVASPSKL